MLNADRRGHHNFSNVYWQRAPPAEENTETSGFYIRPTSSSSVRGVDEVRAPLDESANETRKLTLTLSLIPNPNP